MTKRDWTTAGAGGEPLLRALAGLPGSVLTSFLLTLADLRARERSPADVLRQWEVDTFTGLAAVDLRRLLRAELRLLDAAAGFEAVELAPLAPLATCAAVGPTSQNKIVTTMRGTEVVSDSTNVLALECARRLRRDPHTPVRLATCQRVVRAQEVPRRPGYAHHFKLFSLATAGRQTRDHGFLVDALVEHVRTLLRGFDQLTQEGFTFGRRSVRLLATTARNAVADRIAEQLAPVVDLARRPLDHDYYDGLRFIIEIEAPDGSVVPIADGGAFDWVARLAANRRLVFVASGLGTQLVVLLFGGSASLQSRK
ncbi:hypothetical protein [Nannocystis bainbridge]|uniref:Uncharacterized protein n=1 Tax=Nannocystis bainbridge TaxID=2995303 RepID=A0ABT5DUR1_9BACT|nr:hypothetical protein [Nannocystis bainbridge]MDC0716885.1 hypothetical protein [Nannocystis bainbridge]